MYQRKSGCHKFQEAHDAIATSSLHCVRDSRLVPVDVQIGRGVVKRGGKDVALVAYGTMVNNALAAAEMLAKSGVTATVADMRSAS